jgi:hypothetical protein
MYKQDMFLTNNIDNITNYIDYNNNQNNNIDEDIQRIIIVLAGYNQKKYSIIDKIIDKASQITKNPSLDKFLNKTIGYEKGKILLDNILIKLAYAEDLIDTVNKSIITIDRDKNHSSIYYPLKVIKEIKNTYPIIIGNKKTLEEVIWKEFSKEDIKEKQIIEQGKSFMENALIGNNAWNKAYEQFSKEKYVSNHKFILFADAFSVTKESLIDAILKIEEKDADISFGWCEHNPNSTKRIFFDYRPWSILKDSKFRNANIGAVKYNSDNYLKLNIPEKSIKLMEEGYSIRKLKNPKNIFKLLKNFSPIVIRYFSGSLPFLSRLKPSIKDIEYTIEQAIENKKEKVNFSLIKVMCELEPDIDSQKDIKRARKMLEIEHINQSLDQDKILNLYEKCLISGCKYIEVIGKQIYKIHIINLIPEIIEETNNNNSLYNGLIEKYDRMKLIYYDLMNAYKFQKEKNRIIISANIENTANALIGYKLNIKTNKLESYPFDIDYINNLLKMNCLYSTLIMPEYIKNLTKKQKRTIFKSIYKINNIEKKDSNYGLDSGKVADKIIREYIS